MSSNWITDRLPTEQDSVGRDSIVWVWRKSRWREGPEQIFTECWYDVELGTPWAPINPPLPPNMETTP